MWVSVSWVILVGVRYFGCVQTGGALVMITVVLFDLVTVSM